MRALLVLTSTLPQLSLIQQRTINPLISKATFWLVNGKKFTYFTCVVEVLVEHFTSKFISCSLPPPIFAISDASPKDWILELCSWSTTIINLILLALPLLFFLSDVKLVSGYSVCCNQCHLPSFTNLASDNKISRMVILVSLLLHWCCAITKFNITISFFLPCLLISSTKQGWSSI